jgi:uncharacterized membrane protein (DUF4010 family)
VESLILRLGLALAIGLLVGLERGWRERDAPDRSRTAGIRTYGISGLLGGVFAALSAAADSNAVLIAGFLGFAAIFAWFKSREAVHDVDFSVTGVVAGVSVFALGALAVAGDHRAAAAGGAALAAVLASREVLHGLLRRLTWIELRSALILAVMTAIVLPLLPDRTVDPWGGLNPREVWFFTVLIAAISFVGYVAVRVLGQPRGLLVSALGGAVVSSTAVTVALARNARSTDQWAPLAGAASLAAMVSILRVTLIVVLVEPRVFPAMAAPALAGALVFGICGTLLLFRKGSEIAGTLARNPFELVPLLLFAALFALVSTASAAVADAVGPGGLLATSSLSGAFDVDVAVLSALRLAGGTVGIADAGLAVLAALATNAVARLSLAALAGSVRFSGALALLTLLALGAAAATWGVLGPLG